MIRATLPMALAACMPLPAPSAAQTFAEAVWTNMAIAIQYCDAEAQGPMVAQAFRNAGFSERVERSTGNADTTHWFTAPAETVVVELYYGEMAPSCRASTAHQGVTMTSLLLDALIPQRRPGYLRKVETGPVNPATGQPAICVRYEQPGSEIPHIIGVWTDDLGGPCREDGTSTVSNFSAV